MTKQGEQEARAAEAGEQGLLDEELHEYAAKMGRWTREATEDIDCPDFWITMQVANASRGPLDHCRRWLMKRLKHRQSDAAAENKRPAAVDFFCKACRTFLEEWEALLFDESKKQEAWHVFNGLEEQASWEWIGCAVLACLSPAADYYRCQQAHSLAYWHGWYGRHLM